MKELTLDAKTENLNEALAFVDEWLQEMGCPLEVQMQIDVAVEEMFVNIASYAYDPAVGPVTIQVERQEDMEVVHITFVDHGIPYNPLEKADPDTKLSAEKRPIGGLGIFLVKKIMDDISYEYKNGQNILRISKNI